MVNSEKEKNKMWVYLAIFLGVIIVLSNLLDFLAEGVPLNFNLPFLNITAKLSRILYYSIIVIGTYVGYIGLKELILEKRFSVEFLMALAVFGAAYLGVFFEGAIVLILYLLAEYFEGYIEDRARKTIEKLSAYMPEKARVLENGVETSVNVKDVKPGMTILVKPGERLPLDGIIEDGAAYVDQSLVTGESFPVLKQEDDAVFAGTLNTDGVLKIKITKESEETLVSRIVKLVMQSRERKANIERLVSRFARIYVPIVILLAVLTAVVPSQFFGERAETWLYRSLILLVISCPSAFILSVPATIFTAITVAARRGIIIKGGVYVEKMSDVGAILFDKTGTLTSGSLKVLRECPYTHPVDDEVLKYVAALEQYSSHPAAKAIVERAEKEGLDFRNLPVKNVKEIAGKGVIGDVNGVRVGVGRMEMLENESEVTGNNGSHPADRHSKVYAIMGKSFVTDMCLTDKIRDDAVGCIQTLKKEGIRTVMLTGDKHEIAEDVAKELGVDEFRAELLPEDKLKILSEFGSRRDLVAMVGDGVNDAPALAGSDVGIAMGGSGVDVALESADIVLVKNELSSIPYLRKLSKKAMKIAKQNITVSLGVKLLLGVLGFFGFIPLWFAVAAGDDGVTMLLLLNTLRLAKV